jgi:hypothetical protein
LTDNARTEHYSWCLDHDHIGPCLSDEVLLPQGGTAWIEALTTPKIVVSLGRLTKDHLPELEPAEARYVSAILARLANQADPFGTHPN